MQNVESSIQPQKEHVVSSYVLYIFQFVNHRQLGKDSQGLEPDAEGPQEF